MIIYDFWGVYFLQIEGQISVSTTGLQHVASHMPQQRESSLA